VDTTRPSLLIRLKDPRDTAAWAEFEQLYAPLLYRYARARGLSHDDAEDVRASCYESIVRQIRSFDYDKQRGSFKAWLRTLVNRRVVDLLRKRRDEQAGSQQLAELPDREPQPDELWEQHWKEQHLAFCLEQVRHSVTAQTYEAFQLLMQDLSVEDVCTRLGLVPRQVYRAKSRVLQLVRESMATMYAEGGA
jgi:RNA polymerase sigma-70 factor (ECF subfamily)